MQWRRERGAALRAAAGEHGLFFIASRRAAAPVTVTTAEVVGPAPSLSLQAGTVVRASERRVQRVYRAGNVLKQQFYNIRQNTKPSAKVD